MAANQIGENVVDALRGASLLVTGGTGFLGSWMVDVLVALNYRHKLGITLTLLTRDISLLSKRRPDWADTEEIRLLQGDVRTFPQPEWNYSHVVHAATDVGIMGTKPIELSETIVSGSRHVLDVAEKAGAKRYLYFSSGAVAGHHTGPHLIGEEITTAPPINEPGAYGNAKRFSEHLHLLAAAEFGFEMVIARGFSFVGPRMPLDKFAVGNFIRDALCGVAPYLQTRGLSLRSYLYAADAAVWLITLLALGKGGRIYNIGAENAITVSELAEHVARILGSSPPEIPVSTDDVHSCYVPDTSRIRGEFGLIPTVLLDAAICNTAQWARNSRTTT